jgi:hypothetical protein
MVIQIRFPAMPIGDATWHFLFYRNTKILSVRKADYDTGPSFGVTIILGPNKITGLGILKATPPGQFGINRIVWQRRASQTPSQAFRFTIPFEFDRFSVIKSGAEVPFVMFVEIDSFPGFLESPPDVDWQLHS